MISSQSPRRSETLTTIADDMYFHLYKDAAGQWRWRLVAGNNQIVATSGESYVKKADAEHGIDLVKGTNSSTPVRE